MAPIAGPLVACENGYHLCSLEHLFEWAAPCLYEAEVRGETLAADNKIVAREARLVRRVRAWNRTSLLRFACDCAERVLPSYEQRYPGDGRPRAAITAAGGFLNGTVTRARLRAARDAVWSAYGDVTRSPWALPERERAARAVAAHNALDAAARVAETPLLRGLYAAVDAARDVCSAAAFAAGYAASADLSADAVYQAAADAERAWQHARLAQHLAGGPMPPVERPS
jgi:hypothetical protein